MVPESAPPCFKGHVKREAEVRPGSYDNAGAYAYGLKAVITAARGPPPRPCPRQPSFMVCAVVSYGAPA